MISHSVSRLIRDRKDKKIRKNTEYERIGHELEQDHGASFFNGIDQANFQEYEKTRKVFLCGKITLYALWSLSFNINHEWSE